MAEIPQATEQPAPQESRDTPPLRLVVRNTFLEVVDDQPFIGTLKHSKSDSDIGNVLMDRLLPSVGSAKHCTNDCKPCSFFTKDRCTSGYDCTHCHYPHEKKPRPGKKHRIREKAFQANAIGKGHSDVVQAMTGNGDILRFYAVQAMVGMVL